MRVTLSYRARADQRRRAEDLCRLPCLEPVDRDSVGDEEAVLMVSRVGLMLRQGDRNHRWHVGLLHTRIHAGWQHPLVRAMALEPGDRVLDCTLGLGTDASFLAQLTGRTVVGVEAVPAVALFTASGLRDAGHDVTVVCAEATAFLRTLPDGAFDVVQGDPMFPPGTGKTHSLSGIRLVAHYEALGPEWLHEARRVAKKRVVVRDLWHGKLLTEMGAEQTLGGRSGRPLYGMWSGYSSGAQPST